MIVTSSYTLPRVMLQKRGCKLFKLFLFPFFLIYKLNIHKRNFLFVKKAISIFRHFSLSRLLGWKVEKQATAHSNSHFFSFNFNEKSPSRKALILIKLSEPQKVPSSVIVKLQFQGCALFVLHFFLSRKINMSRPKIDNNDVDVE